MRGHYVWFAPARRLEETARLAARAPAQRVLEVGCGDGVLLEGVIAALRARPERVVGVDLSVGRLTRARSRVAGEFVCASADRLPVRGGGFDLVVCAEVLEHLLDPDAALRELARALAPGGRLVLTVPVVGWSRWIEARLTGRVRFLDEQEHVREFAAVPLPRCETVATLFERIGRAGLRVTEERGAYAFPHRGERLWHALLGRGPLHGPAVALDRAIGASRARRWGRYLLLEAVRRDAA
ncbi:MAG TPA: methyltransferase domain-containing protein [Candidatus Saccharimonadaceae bacterium]|jgi:SAM-dependent methyltransferase|nr:methyltransferase domain-containing protein [Candidatus Saccharimonadaceae bacterium]